MSNAVNKPHECHEKENSCEIECFQKSIPYGPPPENQNNNQINGMCSCAARPGPAKRSHQFCLLDTHALIYEMVHSYSFKSIKLYFP